MYRVPQREYLEKTVDSLKRKLAKDSELHRTDNLRVMQVRACVRERACVRGVAGCCWQEGFRACLRVSGLTFRVPRRHARLCASCPRQQKLPSSAASMSEHRCATCWLIRPARPPTHPWCVAAAAASLTYATCPFVRVTAAAAGEHRAHQGDQRAAAGDQGLQGGWLGGWVVLAAVLCSRRWSRHVAKAGRRRGAGARTAVLRPP